MSARRVGLAAVAIVAFGFLVETRALAPPAERNLQTAAEIVKDQIKLIAMAQKALKPGLTAPPLPGQRFLRSDYRTDIVWSLRRVEKQREAGNKAEYIDALKNHRDFMKALLAEVKMRFDAGLTGNVLDVYDAQYELMEAELRLARAERE